jgi:hypothetical protein
VRWFVVPTHWDTGEQPIACEDETHGRAILAMHGDRVTLCGLEKQGSVWREIRCISRDGFDAIGGVGTGMGFAISKRYRQYLGLDNE